MKKDILIGIVGVVLGLAIGFVVGQEYFKYQIRTELSKGIEHFAGLFGVNREVKKTDKVTKNAKNEPIKQATPKEVLFDDSRMSNEGYLNTKWGMNTQKVLDVTGGNLIQGKGVYVDSEIAGDNSTVFFSFVSDKLYKVVVLVRKETVSHDNYIPVFNEIEVLLNDKYGKAKSKKRIRSRNRFISDGMAIATGEGFYVTKWGTPESLISLILDGDNFKIKLRIFYESKKYRSMAEKEEKEKAKNKL